jgi:hypothetical protein
MDTNQFIEKSQQIYGDEHFDYSETIYIDTRHYVKVKCNTTGYTELVTPSDHYSSCKGCKSIKIEKILCYYRHIKSYEMFEHTIRELNEKNKNKILNTIFLEDLVYEINKFTYHKKAPFIYRYRTRDLIASRKIIKKIKIPLEIAIRKENLNIRFKKVTKIPYSQTGVEEFDEPFSKKIHVGMMLDNVLNERSTQYRHAYRKRMYKIYSNHMNSEYVHYLKNIGICDYYIYDCRC